MSAFLNLSWTYSGVNHSLAGNGGPECTNFITLWRRFWETLGISALSIFYIVWGLYRLYIPKQLTKNVEQRDRFGKRMLLVLMCLTFGCEIGFKLSTRTLIYLLNPCHIVTVFQIYLLASPPHRHVTTIFRCHFHCLNGAFLALAFPVLNTRMLPFEKEVYYIQHIMMLVIPFYLLRVGGVYTVERIRDFSWTMVVLGAILLYHFVVMQGLGLATQVNLNNMLCPAVSDPFRGQNYRIWAVGHQSLLIWILGKSYVIISWALLVLVGHSGKLYHEEEMVCNGPKDVDSPMEGKGFWSRMGELWQYNDFTNCRKISNGHVD
uniref:Transmembrane protein 164 n=1 Tax=Strigamia maritima TaxID=126957 RepID=T1IW07_STRMM